MIVLDTNVISEAMKPEPNEAVRTWLNNQVAETLYLSSVTLAELLYGIAALPAGKRKNVLSQALEGLLELFDGRILPFDTDAARLYAGLAMKARTDGRGFPTPDGYIAAIAASRGFRLASRDVGPFEAVGVTVINPWASLVTEGVPGYEADDGPLSKRDVKALKKFAETTLPKGRAVKKTEI